MRVMMLCGIKHFLLKLSALGKTHALALGKGKHYTDGVNAVGG